MLKSAARITELFGKGLRSHGALVSVYHQAGSGLVAFVIPRRYGSAVERNLAKRRLREIFRQHKDWFPPRRDLVIYIRPKVGQASYSRFAEDLEKVAARIRRNLRAWPPAPPGEIAP
jgi:ribonuclease P protein component